MKNFLQKGIIALVTLGIFLMPISITYKKSHISLKENLALAESLELPRVTANDTTASFTAILLNTEDESEYHKPLEFIVSLYTADNNNGVGSQRFSFLPETERQNFPVTFTNLTPNTNYRFTAYVYHEVGGSLVKEQSFTTTDDPNKTNIGGSNNNPIEVSDQEKTGEYDLGCSLIRGLKGIVGCIAGIFYTLWEISAWIAELAGKFLDFFIYYSTDSTSYRSLFVEKGWSAMRDIANIFFIIALLYIAIKTILGLGGHEKKMIGYVIIFALLINFSLFTTKVVIDSSNILAKIFYNHITPVDSNGKALGNESGGERSISIGLIKNYNPQKVISEYQYNEDESASRGRFIAITIILIAITLYTAYIFFSVALLFVARVVSLWIAMIFSPVAFASYTIPFKIPGMGHKEWWENLFSAAFLAPIFVFLLYLIVMFAGFLSSIVSYPEGAGTFQKIMSVIIPFMLLVGLLKQAKSIAVKYAGEMGKTIIGAAQMIGGAALGIGLGGAAMLGRASLGRVGSMIANSERLKEAESKGKWGAATLRNIGKATGKGSMDLRGAKVMGQTLGSFTGMKVNTFGGPQKGGFEKIKADKLKKRQERAKELELGENSEQKLALKKAQVQLKALENYNHHELEELDKKIENQRLAVKDANDARSADPNNEEKRKLAQQASEELQKLKDEKQAIKEGGGIVYKRKYDGSFELNANGNKIAETNADGSIKYNTNNGYISKQAVDSAVDKATKAEIQSSKSGEEAAEASAKYNKFMNEENALKEEAKNRLKNIARKSIEDIDKTVLAARNTESSARNAYTKAVNTFGVNSTEALDAKNSLDAAVNKLQSSEQAAIDRKASVTSKYLKDLQESIKKIDDEKAGLKNKMDNAIDIATEDANNATEAGVTAASAMDALVHAQRNGKAGRSMKELETEDIPHLHGKIAYIENTRRENYATHISSDSNKTINMFTSGFQHSNEGADEAAYKIRMGMKTESHH